MLQSLKLGPIRSKGAHDLPPILWPLVSAAERGLDLGSELESLTRRFAFDTFFYAVTTCPRPDHEGCIYFYTTHPMAWVVRYDQQAYAEVDPRISDCWDRTVPLIWDQVHDAGTGRQNGRIPR